MNKFFKFILAVFILLNFIQLAISSSITTKAPVTLGNQTVFNIKTGIGPFSAQKRADYASKKLEKIAKDPYSDINSITILQDEYSTEIILNDTVITTIFPKDAAIAKKSRINLAKEDMILIKAAIKKYRNDYSPRRIASGIIYTILVTIALILLIKTINYIYSLMLLKLEVYERKKIGHLYLQKLKLLSEEKILFWTKTGLNSLRIVIFFIIFYSYLLVVLSFFPWTFPLAIKLSSIVVKFFQQVLTSFLAYTPNLLVISVTITITYYLFKFLDYIFSALKHEIISFSWFYPEWAATTRELVKFLVIAFVCVLIYPILPGADTATFKGFSILAGVLVSIGSTRLMSNIISGIILTYTRSFNEGERVHIADKYGDIIDKDLLVTRIKTIKNEIISIPNSKVLDSEVINYSRLSTGEGLILHSEVTIGYNTPREQIESLLIQAAEITDSIITDNEGKKPFVFEKSLDNYYITYELNAYTDNAQKIAYTYSELHKNIIDVFNQANIEIMSPTYYELRDGNQITIPKKYLSEDYNKPMFNLKINKDEL